MPRGATLPRGPWCLGVFGATRGSCLAILGVLVSLLLVEDFTLRFNDGLVFVVTG